MIFISAVAAREIPWKVKVQIGKGTILNGLMKLKAGMQMPIT
jgi:hypothetical protein